MQQQSLMERLLVSSWGNHPQYKIKWDSFIKKKKQLPSRLK
jgi:hypothetical protein